MLAAKRGHELAVRALVTAGADIFCRDVCVVAVDIGDAEIVVN